jgi:hypothetical protein
VTDYKKSAFIIRLEICAESHRDFSIGNQANAAGLKHLPHLPLVFGKNHRAEQHLT